jgi:hypothetical protein
MLAGNQSCFLFRCVALSIDICIIRNNSSGGKQRSKIEVELNSQRHDAGGDTRKIVTAMANNEKNRLHGHK